MNISRIYHTVKHLKPIQIRYLLWYRIRPYWRKLNGFKYPLSIKREGFAVILNPFIKKNTSFEDDRFSFLNQSKTFSRNNIDWNYSEYGKLWTYNLNYFDFLNQEQLEPETGLKLIDDYITKLNQYFIGLEPYPIALRGINWIKFFSQESVFTLLFPRESAVSSARKLDHIINFLYAQYQILSDNPEYHLLGNHLLEDAMSLLFGAFYFKDEQFYQKASALLYQELDEQILADGGHFELSPMYHQIILDRLLDCINLLKNNHRFIGQHDLLIFLENKASAMLTWLNNMTFSNGQIPLFNDSTLNIAPTTKQLNNYAKRLNLNLNLNLNLILSASGYRKFTNNNYECIIDIGQIGPSFQPGHAHADMLNFVLHIDNKPIIIDTGISTYEKNDQRQLERSSSSHNTVVVDEKNQSEVWGGFRVGKRAKINLLKDEDLVIEAEHNGYKPVIHNRTFHFNQAKLFINDELKSLKGNAKTYFHFHPDRKVERQGSTILIDNKYTLEFKTITNIKLGNYNCPRGYNKYSSAIKCIVEFKSSMQTEINING